MYWQNNGDYLVLLLDQSLDRRPHAYINLAIFKTREADVPIEFLEFERESMIIAFAWEPKGHRFALIQGQQNPMINFFSIQGSPRRSSMSKLVSLEGVAANSLFWSPARRVILIVGLTSFSGQLIFYDIDQLQVLATRNGILLEGLLLLEVLHFQEKIEG